MNLIITILGSYVTFDGLFSIWLYKFQSKKEHVVRALRAIIGIIFSWLGLVI